MSQKLNALQISTAEQLLRNTLSNKKNKIREEKLQKAIQPFHPMMKKLLTNAEILRKEALKIKRIVEKNPNLIFKDQGNYSFIGQLMDLDEKEFFKETITAKTTGSYNNYTNPFTPNFSKEEEEIEKFILGLKLGTTLMSELQPLLDKINKL